MSDFIRNDSGAVTVDWVVLTAAVVGLGIAVVTTVRSGINALGGDISASLASASVAALHVLGPERPDGIPESYALFSDNYLRLLYARWNDPAWVTANNRDNADTVVVRLNAEMAYRGIDATPPSGATTCANIQAIACWNDATDGT